MTKKTQQKDATHHGAAKYYEGLTSDNGDVCIHQRLFTYNTDAGVVGGADINVIFTIDRTAREVWPYLRDFNQWQNSYGYYYTGIVGDLYSSPERELGNRTFRIASKPDDPASLYPFEYKVLMVVPERLIVVFQPVPEDGGNGGISPGFHVFMLSERDGKCIVTIQMEHATRTRGISEAEALEPWGKEHAPEVERFWRDIFIPNLKKLVHEGR